MDLEVVGLWLKPLQFHSTKNFKHKSNNQDLIQQSLLKVDLQKVYMRNKPAKLAHNCFVYYFQNITLMKVIKSIKTKERKTLAFL